MNVKLKKLNYRMNFNNVNKISNHVKKYFNNNKIN